MTRTKEHKMLYAILGVGAFGTFFGHGMWAIDGKDSFVGLLTGSLKNVFGIDMSAATGKTVVQVIGVFDLVVAVAIGLLIIGAIRESGTLYRAAYSKLSIGIFSWAVLWGFVTAFSRITAAAEWYPAFWDWVERAPNWMLPAALVYVIVRHRTAIIPSHVTYESELVES